jgi:hypothetical protein
MRFSFDYVCFLRYSRTAWRNHQTSHGQPKGSSAGVLELNWRNVRNILQRTCHVLPRLFVGLFSKKKKKEMPAGNLRNLVEAFETLEDPILQLKLSSMRRGVEGMIALTQSHGENVDSEKERSAYARHPEEMKEFFSEAKKYVPNIVSLVLPVPRLRLLLLHRVRLLMQIPQLLRWHRLLLILLDNAPCCLFCCNQVFEVVFSSLSSLILRSKCVRLSMAHCQ